MDLFCRELEEAASNLSTAFAPMERERCSNVIARFRNTSHPYELCKYLLNTSRNFRVIYEVGKCLSNAIIREWDTILCPSGTHVNAANMTQSIPYQLLCYLIHWVASYQSEGVSCAIESILSAVATIVKRAAAAEARHQLSQQSLQTSQSLSTLTLSSVDNPCFGSPLVTFFLGELGSLLSPVPASSSYEQEYFRLTLGVRILSAFLDEMSNTDNDPIRLNLPLEAHVYMLSRFQDFELLQLFQLLLSLVESLLSLRDWPGDDWFFQGTSYNLLHCLEVITSWSFLPDRIVDPKCLRPIAKKNAGFRPSERWACVFGVNSISGTLSIFLKLHSRCRFSEAFSNLILTSILAITSLSGPLVVTHNIDRKSAPLFNNGLLVEHACICMSALAHAFALPHGRPLLGINALLLSSTDLARTFDFQINDGSGDLPAPYPRVAEIETIFKPIASYYTTSGFLSHELPLLAELSVNLLRRFADVCGVVENFVVANGWQTTNLSEDQDAVLARLIFYLNSMNAFLGLVKTILLDCILLEACALREDTKNVVDLYCDMRDAHEASERIFSHLCDISETIPHFDATNTALSYTTGPSATLDRMMCILKQACGHIRANFQKHQHDLIRVYIASHLAPPIGFRRDPSTNRFDDEEEDFDLDLNLEKDDIAYEDSLFALGQFISGSEGEALTEVLEMLTGLLEDRACLFNQQGSEVPLVPLKDLHWLLLLSGHVLVTGPSEIGSSKDNLPTWDTNYSIPYALWSVGPRSYAPEVLERCRQFLAAAIENTPFNEVEGVPSVLRLLGILFRLLRLFVTAEHERSVDPRDILWVFVRLTLAYFSQNNFIGSESHWEDYSEGTATSESGMTFVQALLRSLTHLSPTLTLFARLAITKWRSSRRVSTLTAALLAAIARRFLLVDSNSKLEESDAAIASTQAWIEVCNVVCRPEAWTSIHLPTFADLVDACARGCWCLRSVQAATSTSTGLFYEFVEGLRMQLTNIINAGDVVTEPQKLSISISEKVLLEFAAVKGLARAIRWIVAFGSNPLSGPTSLSSVAATTGANDTDLVGFVWTGIFLPILRNCSVCFVRFDNSIYSLMTAVFELFEEVADSCLIYLANCPATLAPNYESTVLNLTNGLQLRFPLPHTGSTQFFILVIIICAQYVQSQQRAPKTYGHDECERVTELRHLFSLLQYFLGHEFELRLHGVTGTGLQDADGMMTTVDITLVCIGFLLPLLKQSLLAIPDLACPFYHLLSYALELRPEGILHLVRARSPKTLSELGRLLRYGVFNVSETTVNISALEAITYLAEFCSTHGTNLVPNVAATAIRVYLPLGKGFLRELLDFVLRDTFPTQLEISLSNCIFALATLDLRSFGEVVNECIAQCPGGPTIQRRLQTAFLDLSEPLVNATTALTERKKRSDFEGRFHTFVPTKGLNGFAAARHVLLSTQPNYRTFYITHPSADAGHHLPVFYSRVVDSDPLNAPFDSLPCLRVSTLPDTSEFAVKITGTRLFFGPKASLILCLTLHDAPADYKLHLEILVPRTSFSSITTANCTEQRLFAVFPTPRSFEDIRLQIRSSDWLIHLPLPIDLESVQSIDEEGDEELEDAVSSITHPWKFSVRITGEDADVADRLSKLFQQTISFEKWINLKRGLFTDSRLRLSRGAAKCFNLESMSCHSELNNLLLDFLKREGLLANEAGGEVGEEDLGLVTLHDLRDALLTELGLLKSALCAPLVRHVLSSRVPLVTDPATAALIPSASVLKIADLVADWRNAAAGTEPIDQATAVDVVGGNFKIIAAACSTTDSIVTRLAA